MQEDLDVLLHVDRVVSGFGELFHPPVPQNAPVEHRRHGHTGIPRGKE